MKAKGWKNIIIGTTYDDNQLQLLAKHLEEADSAKQLLRDKGYGWGGLSLLKTVELIPKT